MRLSDEYLSKRLERDCKVLDAQSIGGGYTDKVYLYTLATDGGQWKVVIRHEALGAFRYRRDLAGHFRLISALHERGLPVPKPLFYDPVSTFDGRVFGMEFVPGDVIMPWGRSRRELIASLATEDLRDDFVRILCNIHWTPAWNKLPTAPRSREQLLEDVVALVASLPTDDGHLVRDAIAVLRNWSPANYGMVIVHGDYHLGNLVLSETRKIAAVIDWEYAGVGDPLYDVAWILAPHFMSAAGGVSGLMSEAQFLARYRRFSGIDFRSADVAYWRIFQQLRIHAMFADSVHRTARADAEHARYRRLEAALPRQRKDLRMLVEGFSRFSS